MMAEYGDEEFIAWMADLIELQEEVRETGKAAETGEEKEEYDN